MVSHARTSLIAVGVLLMSLVPAGAVSAGQAAPVTGQSAHLNAAPARPAYLDSAQPVALRVKDLLGRMTLEEKIGQMTQAERGAVAGDPSQIATLRLGSVLSGGGSTPTPNTPAAWVDMVNEFQEPGAEHPPAASRIIYGIDAVHGHGNVYGATVFPHNIGLGATRDPALVEKVGAGHRRGGTRDRHPVELRAVRLRRPRRAVGPHLRELRRGPDAGRPRWRRSSTACRVTGGRRSQPTTSWPPRSTTRVTATPSTTTRPPLPTWASRGTSSGTRSTRASR